MKHWQVRVAAGLIPATLLGVTLLNGGAQAEQAQPTLQAPQTQQMSQTQQVPEPQVIYEKHTVVTFDADLLDGDLQSPDAQFIDAERRRGRTPLIQVRKDFRPEVLRSLPNRQ